jgi:hypothetical protein
MECARRIGRNGFTAAEAATVTEEASEMCRQLSADKLARFLGVTYAVRQRLGLTTIGSINVGTQARKELRERRNRITKERKRRALGMKPRTQYEANSLSQTRPWERLGMSRRQWYRKRHQPNGTSPGTAHFVTCPACFLRLFVAFQHKMGALSLSTPTKLGFEGHVANSALAFADFHCPALPTDLDLRQVKLRNIGTGQEAIWTATSRNVDLVEATRRLADRGPIATADVFKMKAN